MRTIKNVIDSLPRPDMAPLPAPAYRGDSEHGVRLGLAVEAMRRHTSDEGWELFRGLEQAGYQLAGNNILTPGARLPVSEEVPSLLSKLEGYWSLTDVPAILGMCNPSVVVLQDQREIDGLTADKKYSPCFTRIDSLKDRADIFKLTILKDAHQRPDYHRDSAVSIGCHAWIVYYSPEIVSHLAPYVRPQHLIRTYHSVNFDNVPPYSETRLGRCLVSGALSGAYPLRLRITKNLHKLPAISYLPHPGYHSRGCNTPEYLKTLSEYKVALCTSSIYGYALRKIVEATACGCRVITDLPADEHLPGIDGNLIRIGTNIDLKELNHLVECLSDSYDPILQRGFVEAARWYDYRAIGQKLADDIETMRENYP